jgi:hypothetical protein
VVLPTVRVAIEFDRDRGLGGAQGDRTAAAALIRPVVRLVTT